MNEQVEIPDTPTPDILEKNTKGIGVKRLNKSVIWVICGVLAIPLFSWVYTGELRSASTRAKAESSDMDKYNISNVAMAPARPVGPDVSLPKAGPVHYIPGEVDPSGMQMQDSEAERQARAKKVAALEAAMSAPAEVERFNTGKRLGAGSSPTGYGSVAGVRVDGTVPPPPGQGRGEDELTSSDQDQAHKRNFMQSTSEYSPYLKQTRQPAVSQFVINAGFIIPGITVSGINSDLPGLIVGQVRQNVFDSATGNHLLIPAGARLVGTYDSEVSGGQERALVAWNRIIYPDSSSVYLETMPGADQAGLAGFKDQVNNHYFRTFGQAFLLSLFSAATQLSQPRGSVQGTYNAQQIGAAAMGQQMAQLGMQLARRNLNRQPTLEIRPGFTFNVMVNKDMVLPVWKGHPQAVAIQQQN